MLQVLWEQGWIDTSKIYDYTTRGKNNGKGAVIQETSLIHLMEQFRYFSEEDTQLHYIGSKLRATVDRTPKCYS